MRSPIQFYGIDLLPAYLRKDDSNLDQVVLLESIDIRKDR